MQTCLRPMRATDKWLLALMGSANKVPNRISGSDALAAGWGVLVPGLTGSPSHRIVLAIFSGALPLCVAQTVMRLCHERRQMLATVGVAACHDRPNDARSFVGERNGGDANRLSREQIKKTRIHSLGFALRAFDQ